ncbi:MAG: CHC2 zinc finger domain-containing protein, partial [bacterium]
MPGRIPPDIIERIRESTDIVELISQYVHLEHKGGNYFGLCPFHPEKTPSFSVHPGKGIFHCFGCGVGGNAFTFLQLHDKLSFAEAARELARHSGITIPEDDKPQQREKYDTLYRVNEIACAFFERCLWEGKGEEYDAVREYLKERQISPSLAKMFRLGYAPDRWDGLLRYCKKMSQSEPGQREFWESTTLWQEAGLILAGKEGFYDRFRGRLIFPIMNLSSKPIGFGARALKKDETAKYINTPE